MQMKNKKINISVIAVAAFAASSAAMAQSSVTLYGMLDAGIGYTSNINGHSRFGLDGGAAGSNKWGLRGQEDLGGGLQAVFKIENGFNIGTGGIGGQGRSAPRVRCSTARPTSASRPNSTAHCAWGASSTP